MGRVRFMLNGVLVLVFRFGSVIFSLVNVWVILLVIVMFRCMFWCLVFSWV